MSPHYDDNLLIRISQQVSKTVSLKFDVCREIKYMHILNSLLGLPLPICIIAKICNYSVNDCPELVCCMKLYKHSSESVLYYISESIFF